MSGLNAVNEDWTAADMKRKRHLLIGQNLFYLRGLLDAGEEEINEAMGLIPAR